MKKLETPITCETLADAQPGNGDQKNDYMHGSNYFFCVAIRVAVLVIKKVQTGYFGWKLPPAAVVQRMNNSDI